MTHSLTVRTACMTCINAVTIIPPTESSPSISDVIICIPIPRNNSRKFCIVFARLTSISTTLVTIFQASESMPLIKFCIKSTPALANSGPLSSIVITKAPIISPSFVKPVVTKAIIPSTMPSPRAAIMIGIFSANR